MRQKLPISELGDRSQTRVVSFRASPEARDFVGRRTDMHLPSAAPRTTRGSRDHLLRREVIVVLPSTPRSLHWDEDRAMPAQPRSFAGGSALRVLVSPGASHAGHNDDPRPLWFVALSSEPYDPSESVDRKVV